MRNLTILFAIFFFISCQRKNNDQGIDRVLYLADTVMIDSKGRLLDLNRGIWISDLNDEKSSIFLYNKFDHSIDEINLVESEISNNYPFDIEGPDGTGKHVNYLHVLKEGSFFFKSFGGSAIFNKNGRLLNRIDWINSINSNGLLYGQIPQNEVAISSRSLKVFGLSYDNKNRNVFLDVLSVKENSVKRFDIDVEKSYHNFVLANEDPESYTFMDPYVFLMVENGFVLISHQYSNEIFQFNSRGEPVQTVKYESKMTPNRVKDIGIPEQLYQEYQHMLEQVRFGPPVWDSVNKRYFRLSASRIFKERKAGDTFLPELQEIKVYVSVFDAGFNLTYEVLVPELNTEFVKYFAKDGKLWVYQNFSDELGFIIIDIEK